MTAEEIKKIAKAYGERVANSFDYDMLPNPREAYRQRVVKETKQAESMLDFLSKNYCIIPKSKLRERYKESKLHSKSESVFDIHTGIARLIMLESLFGKDMFKEDNNQYTIPQ